VGQNLERTAVILKSMDLVESQISLQIFGVQHTEEFLFDKYFKQLNYFRFSNDPENRFEIISTENDYEDFQSILFTRDADHRVAFSTKFCVDGMEVGVKGYREFVEKKRPAYRALDPITNAALSTKTIYMDAVYSFY
jgi:hypothetical protein